MAKQHWKGSVLLAPVPAALVSCGTMENPNVLTIGWTGVLCTHPPMTYISVRPSRHSYPIIMEKKEFVINLTTSAMCKETDCCGVRSGRDVDKFELCGLKKEKAFKVDCPLIEQSPLCLECKVDRIIPLGSHDMILADIVGVSVNEDLIDFSGRMRLDKAHLAAFAHGEYFALGRKLGYFGYSVRKKKKHRKK